MNPDTLTAQALLNCLVREVSAPEEQAWEADGHLMVRLARSDRLLRLGTPPPVGRARPAADRRRGSCTGRTAGSRSAGRSSPGSSRDELTLATGVANEEFAAQVRQQPCGDDRDHAARRQAGAWAADRQAEPVGAGIGGAASPRSLSRYLASEQALIAGHRFHPAPKAREGDPRDWLRFAPEAGARFPLRFLAVRDDALDADGDTTALDRLGVTGGAAGYHLLPAHPWQLRLLARAAVAAAGVPRPACSSTSVPGRVRWRRPRRSAPSTTRWPMSSASSASTCGSPTASARTPGTSWPGRSP